MAIDPQHLRWIKPHTTLHCFIKPRKVYEKHKQVCHLKARIAKLKEADDLSILCERDDESDI